MRAASHQPGRCCSGEGTAIRILIAEDDANVRALILDAIKDLGHAASDAGDGLEAWDVYRERGADVIVSDWKMPGMDGAELCRRVRALEGAPYTYFILLTALGDPEHRIAGMQAGADDYLSKPFSIADLQARLIAAERVTALHRRREALLRQARRVAAENDPERLLHDLVQEATKLVDGAAGLVTRWDAVQQHLVPVGSTRGHLGQTTIRLGEGASGRAAQQRSAVLLGRSECGGLEPELATGDVEAAAAVPLIHEGELIGTLAVAARPGMTFSRQDLETLELLASTTAGALVALERARLEGVLLAARTAQHELNNQLAIARGYAELLVAAPDLPPQLFEVAQEVMRAADDAARIIKQLRTVARIRETRWPEPSDTTINLSASARPMRRRGRLHQAAGHR